jgi:hypothetical protein
MIFVDANSKKIAGELGHDAEAVEAQLSFIFRLTSHWKALVLLDEADVFIQKRSLNHTMNGQLEGQNSKSKELG